MIKLEVIGHLGADAQLKANDRGEFITFQVYHSERFTDRTTGEAKERTIRVSCTRTGNVGNLLPYLRKGFQVYCRGDVELRTYLGQDNQYHSGINMRVTELEPLWEKKQDTAVDPNSNKPF